MCVGADQEHSSLMGAQCLCCRTLQNQHHTHSRVSWSHPVSCRPNGDGCYSYYQSSLTTLDIFVKLFIISMIFDSLVCSWKIEVWTGTGLFWGLQAKVIWTDTFWENWIYMNTLCTLVRDFQMKALHVESYPRDSKRVFGQRWSFPLPFGEWHSRMVRESLRVWHSPWIPIPISIPSTFLGGGGGANPLSPIFPPKKRKGTGPPPPPVSKMW